MPEERTDRVIAYFSEAEMDVLYAAVRSYRVTRAQALRLILAEWRESHNELFLDVKPAKGKK